MNGAAAEPITSPYSLFSSTITATWLGFDVRALDRNGSWVGRAAVAAVVEGVALLEPPQAQTTPTDTAPSATSAAANLRLPPFTRPWCSAPRNRR